MQSTDFKLQLSEQAPTFTLIGIDEKEHSLSEFTKDFLVVIFTCNHCPYAKAYEKKLFALHDEFKDVDFVAINANDAAKYPQDSFEGMQEHAKNWPYPYLHDETQKVATAYGALVTPHVFVLDKHRALVYQGGIDDAFRGGDHEEDVTKPYLHDALKALTAGQIPPEAVTPVVGCSIKWK